MPRKKRPKKTTYRHGTKRPDNPKTFGEALRQVRHDAGHTMPSLAPLLGYSKCRISHVETGRQLPSHDFMKACLKEGVFSKESQKLLMGFFASQQNPILDKLLKECWFLPPDDIEDIRMKWTSIGTNLVP